MRIAEVAVLAILSLLVLLMVIRPVIRRLTEPAPPQATPRLANRGDDPALPSPDGDDDDEQIDAEAMIDLGQIEGRVKASTVRKVGDIVEKHPEETVQIVRNWMYQES